ncbi:MAG: hypothetical protein AAFY66_03015 [Pseudomonadota bacterium]
MRRARSLYSESDIGFCDGERIPETMWNIIGQTRRRIAQRRCVDIRHLLDLRDRHAPRQGKCDRRSGNANMMGVTTRRG